MLMREWTAESKKAEEMQVSYHIRVAEPEDLPQVVRYFRSRYE